MSYCWYCGTKITADNVSKEHVIPNALCGKLKSNNLLCFKCNTKFHQIDRALANDFQCILANISCKKDRGKQPHIIATDKNGTEYKLKNGNPELKDPVFPDKPETMEVNGKKQDVYNIIARSKEELMSMREGIRKKHSDKIVQILKTKEEYKYLPNLDYNDKILSNESFRAVAKIAANFFILKCNNRNLIIDLISYIDGSKTDKSFVGLYFPDLKRKCEVYHHIFLEGNSEEGILYCYIELFGAINYLVILNDNYNGNNFKSEYNFNIETGKENNQLLNISVSKKEVNGIISNKIPIDQLKISLGNFDTVLNSKNALKAVKEIIEYVLNNEISKNTNSKWEVIWPSIVLELNKYPYWKNLQYCAYNTESWDQKGPKCSCGAYDYAFILISINIKGNILFVLLKSVCYNCWEQINFEYKPKLTTNK